jgi:hypothetical protein
MSETASRYKVQLKSQVAGQTLLRRVDYALEWVWEVRKQASEKQPWFCVRVCSTLAEALEVAELDSVHEYQRESA